ncbi:MAG: hypothetical protein R3F62_02800 [Planctomycetota bacterium]
MNPLLLLTNPWVAAASAGAAAYAFYKKSRGQKDDLRSVKLELIEQQRELDRLRAELGRERAHNRKEI